MARRNTTIGGFSELWQRHENLYYGIFANALRLFKATEEQLKYEDAISEALCIVLKEVCFAHPEKPRTPKWEIPIAPAKIDELRGGKIRKRPDFTCSLVNTLAQDVDMYEISLHIECKRLGTKVGSWDLNKNYVENGIKRFDSQTHKYGNQAPSGFMIGYMISPRKSDILNAVNKHMAALMMTGLYFKFSDKVESCDSIFVRKFIEPKDFKLTHLWVDLSVK